MRHVDITGLEVPQSWLTKVAKTLAKVEAAVKAQTVPTFPSHWTDHSLRDVLIAIVGQKCWYCETKVHSSNPDVDHFRPKLGKLATDGHSGYWWLAYEPSNYRISCSYCNSGGGKVDDGSHPATKVARFPLLNEADRAKMPQEDCHREKPVLLDPTDLADCFLIDFSVEGIARRRIETSTPIDAESLRRVTESIAIYQLNRVLLREDRQRVMNDVGDLARLAEPDNNASSLDIIEKLLRAKIDPRTEYSGAALSALLGRRDIPMVTDRFASDLNAYFPDAPPRDAVYSPFTLGRIVREGILHPGAMLTGQVADETVTATLLEDGRIQFGARAFHTPDSAAKAAVGHVQVDGWDFWSVAVEGSPQTLNQIRIQARSISMS